MASNTTLNQTGNVGNRTSSDCIFPPGWTGPPPPGRYAEVSRYLWMTVPPVIMIVGLLGNILTVIILLRQSRKLASTALYLLTLALSDSVMLLNSPLRNWMFRGLDMKDVRHLSEMGCKFSVFFTYTSVQYSSCVLVAVTLERLVSIVWPHRVRLGCTTRASGVVLVILLVFILGLNSHIIYGFGASQLPNYKGPCEPKYNEYMLFWTKTWPWIDFAVAFAIPFVLLGGSNAVIIYKMHETHKRRRSMSASNQGMGHAGHDTTMVTVTLILLTVVFFICLTPVQVFFIYDPHRKKILMNDYYCKDMYEFFKQVEIHNVLFTIVNLISYINAAFNFFLYILSGSKFRYEVIALFTCQPTGEGVFGTTTSASVRYRNTLRAANSTRHLERVTSVTHVSDVVELKFSDIRSTRKSSNGNNNGIFKVENGTRAEIENGTHAGTESETHTHENGCLKTRL
ncbi:type-1 angiotensin II receptor B-like [Dreissena polymorpha]|uniref:G-protein coupled receptors family 1 profile domain-containing protein n=1 Tax=Dreissena polymorpha TaxID=45954 RepID=A0A9D4DAD4_DREPO|nr:type-1 angiotensin II receptor B-like [Dreissena polymorpha]KAH3741913.1 hypothetical protein DPMN_048643 [Dreissena polymorpha]